MQDANSPSLPDDNETCHAIIREQAATISELVKAQEELKRQVTELTLAFKKLLQGKRREQFINPDQKLLEFPDDPELQEALEEAMLEAAKIIEIDKHTRRENAKQPKKRDESFPSHLRREVIDLPLEPEMQKQVDEGTMAIMRHEIREMLKFKRPELYVIQYRKPVLVHVNAPEKGIYTVPHPMAIGDEGRYDASMGAAIVTNKFGFHLPFNRMQDMFASSGWTASRSTIDHITSGVDFLVEPVVDLMKKRILLGSIIGLDDTGVKLLMPREIPKSADGDLITQRLIEKMLEAQKEGNKIIEAKMWAYSGLSDQPYDIFDFRVSRHRDGPAEFLDGYRGYVMADCYSGNLSVILDPKSAMTRMACWTHARRKVFEARETDVNASMLPLALMRQIYDIERRAVDYSAEMRTQIRTKESAKILARLREWMDGPIAKNLLPKSDLRAAINYLENHWEALQVFTRDGSLPIDNNAAERLMKRIATGRKNWLFIGSVRAGIRNARLMSMVSSAHRHDLDVEMYLDSVMRDILAGSTDYQSMLPDIWKKSHPEAIRTYRAEERRDKADRSKLQAAFRRQLNLS